MHLRPLGTDRLHARFAAARPFPHLVLDDLLPREAVLEVARSLPPHAGRRSVCLHDPAAWPAPLARLRDALQGQDFLRQLAAITGVPDLAPDARLPAGLLRLPRGGREDVHADAQAFCDPDAFRHLDLLVFLNPHWEEGWGGELELWDEHVHNCLARVPPVLGRCVLLQCGPESFHGTRRVRAPRGVTDDALRLCYASTQPLPGIDAAACGTRRRARPRERVRGALLPLDSGLRQVAARATRALDRLRRVSRAALRQGSSHRD